MDLRLEAVDERVTDVDDLDAFDELMHPDEPVDDEVVDQEVVHQQLVDPPPRRRRRRPA